MASPHGNPPPTTHTPRCFGFGCAGRRKMEAGEAAGLGHATGLCNRLYNFFARHFASQGIKLVTLGCRGAAAGGPLWVEGADAMADFDPVGDAAAGKVRIGRNVPIGGRGGEAAAVRKAGRPVLRAASNINERSDEFIRSRKEALRSESEFRRPPPN